MYCRLISSLSRRFLALAVAFGLGGILLAAPLMAQSDDPPRGAPDVVSETRFGFQAHDVAFLAGDDEDGFDVNGEILFVSPDFLGFAWSPRPHVGTHINTAGDTSQIYFGLTWDIDITDWLFFEFSFGGSVHDGRLDPPEASNRPALGCRVLFRESLSLGVRFWERHSISTMFDHISNANLCSNNEGLDTMGIRYGYRF